MFFALASSRFFVPVNSQHWGAFLSQAAVVAVVASMFLTPDKKKKQIMSLLDAAAAPDRNLVMDGSQRSVRLVELEAGVLEEVLAKG